MPPYARLELRRAFQRKKKEQQRRWMIWVQAPVVLSYKMQSSESSAKMLDFHDRTSPWRTCGRRSRKKFARWHRHRRRLEMKRSTWPAWWTWVFVSLRLRVSPTPMWTLSSNHTCGKRSRRFGRSPNLWDSKTVKRSQVTCQWADLGSQEAVLDEARQSRKTGRIVDPLNQRPNSNECTRKKGRACIVIVVLEQTEGNIKSLYADFGSIFYRLRTWLDNRLSNPSPDFLCLTQELAVKARFVAEREAITAQDQ